MPSLALYVDLQARQLVQGFTNPQPATLPAINIADTINTTLYFLNQTGVSSAPYSYANLSASSIKEILGIIAGIPTHGTFCLTDGTKVSGKIPYNDNSLDVQGQMAAVTSWSNPSVEGIVGGPWRIVAGTYGALPALTAVNNNLAPSSVVVITQASAGSSTGPAVNVVRLALNPVAEQTAFTNVGSPTYAFTGAFTPNPVTLQQLMGTFLSLSFSFQIQVITAGDTETYVDTVITLKNTLLPQGATFIPQTPSTPGGAFVPAYTSIAGLQALTTFNTLPIGIIVPGLVNNASASFRLLAGGGGILPGDYNASTNNVSWYETQ